MSNEVKTIDKVAENKKALYSVIKKAIFKTADDAEMALYIHKCTEVGVSPLSKLIVPIKFKDTKEGGFIVTFVTTIDVYRSLAEETKEYDGSDEPEYEGLVEVKNGEDTISVPEICRVKVYRKGVSHPCVGVARWKEYYPGEQRGAMWRQMPHTMLAKCAEANGLRKMFPKKLNKLYTEEEMQLTLTAASGAIDIKGTMREPIGSNQSAMPEGDFQQPDEDTRKANKWISSKQEGRIFGLCKQYGVNPENVKQWFRTVKKNANVHLCHITWAGKPSEYDKICETIEKQPKFYDKYIPVAAAPAPAATPEPTAREIFEIQVNDLLDAAGLGNERLDSELKKDGFNTIKNVPEAAFGKFLHDLGESV